MIKLLLIIVLLPVDLFADKDNVMLIEQEIVNCTIETAKQYFNIDLPVVIHFTT